jgi:hypothetical protein
MESAKLPPEIVLHVLEFLFVSEDRAQAISWLKETALVCRSWMVNSQALLFRDITIDKTPTSISRLDFMTAHPHIAHRVRSLQVTGCAGDSNQMLLLIPSLFPHVRSIHLENTDRRAHCVSPTLIWLFSQLKTATVVQINPWMERMSAPFRVSLTSIAVWAGSPFIQNVLEALSATESAKTLKFMHLVNMDTRIIQPSPPSLLIFENLQAMNINWLRELGRPTDYPNFVAHSACAHSYFIVDKFRLTERKITMPVCAI